jgi:hypothetical protein
MRVAKLNRDLRATLEEGFAPRRLQESVLVDLASAGAEMVRERGHDLVARSHADLVDNSYQRGLGVLSDALAARALGRPRRRRLEYDWTTSWIGSTTLFRQRASTKDERRKVSRGDAHSLDRLRGRRATSWARPRATLHKRTTISRRCGPGLPGERRFSDRDAREASPVRSSGRVEEVPVLSDSVTSLARQSMTTNSEANGTSTGVDVFGDAVPLPDASGLGNVRRRMEQASRRDLIAVCVTRPAAVGSR